MISSSHNSASVLEVGPEGLPIWHIELSARLSLNELVQWCPELLLPLMSTLARNCDKRFRVFYEAALLLPTHHSRSKALALLIMHGCGGRAGLGRQPGALLAHSGQNDQVVH